SAGPQWFDMQGAELTEETKRDLHVLQSRAVLDPKRHYKKGTMKTLPKIFQMGTLIEGSTEGRAARLTRKERQKNIVEELLADRSATSYFKRKYNAIQETNNNITRARSKRGKKWKK
ncbi:Fcf2 pre-rRNA processing-domain-containing protein, partial [Phlyctochytrium arcticum]